MDRRKYDNTRYHERRNYLISILGDKCVKCGISESLEIDHIEPELKEFTLSKNWTKPIQELLKELEKCQLLCKECHFIKSNKEQEKEIKHGTVTAYYNKKCRCNECKTVASVYRKSKRKCVYIV